MLEAGARIAFAYLRNLYGLRDSRPPWRFVARTLRFFAAGRTRSNVEADVAGLKVLVSTRDWTIARSVFTSGDWDPLLVGTVFRGLRAYGYDYRDKVFLEVGANFGVYSLPAVAELGFACAVAYEPDPGAFALLEQNIARNALGDRVTAHHAALSAQPGEVTLSLGRGNAGDNRIVDDFSDPQRTIVRVPARTFDDEVRAGRIPLDALGLVWLDVQGHEGEVLAGARLLLGTRVPIVMEYSTGMLDGEARSRLDETLRASFDVFVDLGWCALTGRLRFQPIQALGEIAPGGQVVETDLLLLHW